jgi:hypothetical protein
MWGTPQILSILSSQSTGSGIGPCASGFGGEDFQTNLIMPEPTIFLSRKFPLVSIIRPTETEGAAMGAAHFLTNSGLFRGQSKEFFTVLFQLAQEADAAGR